MPVHFSEGLNKALLDDFLYRPYIMYLAVLAERMAACQDEHQDDGSGCAHFLRAPQPGAHG